MIGYLIVVYVIYGLIFGFITRHVASSKGYDGGFLWGFFLGVIGLLVVGFRPNLAVSSPASEYKPMYGGALQVKDRKEPSWTCVCGSVNPGRLDYCPICRKSRDQGERPQDVKCPHCGAMNNASRDFCVLCDHPLRDDVVLPAKSAEPAQAQKPDESHAQDEGIALLEKLAKLHQDGILTDEEFAQKKSEILSKL